MTLHDCHYLVVGTVDFLATQPGQQFQCQLALTGVDLPLDITPGLSGSQTRVTLTGVAQIPTYTTGVVNLSCTSNSTAKLVKVRLYALHVDSVNPIQDMPNPTF